ncbi:MAG: ATP-grasp domain-containing protein [Deltaproteobacteria bacterium]|nr:ATP-grasp domain-containing protein [Deltaproteobacteria bacterium]
MRIALTHNLRLSETEDEAEFDTEATVNALATAIERLGHRVERVEVSGPASRTVSRLEAYAPDLIFNTAEGRRGRFREAFYPALFEELGIPYTGSDAYALAVTLDKQLTKLILRQHGVRTPAWQFLEEPAGIDLARFHFPVIVKPNFEGSSKGITQESVVEDPSRLEPVVQAALARYPAGVLVEEYVAGRDVAVPFLEGEAKERGGVLAPLEYLYDEKITGPRRYPIYDYALKTRGEGAVVVKAPAVLARPMAEKMAKIARRVFETFKCREVARIDFRVTEEEFFFLELNALPSLQPGAGIYASAALEGLHFDGVLGAIIESASRRHGLKDSAKSRAKPVRKSGPLRVGFAYNVKRVKPDADGRNDDEAEYDSPKTLQAIREAIASYGHEVVDLEANSELAAKLTTSGVDVVFNVAEGLRGRNREAHVPALCELLDIPYTGSDPATLSIALDKGLAKRMLRQEGVLTPGFMLMTTGKERLKDLKFPMIVKPVAEGSSKGVQPKSVVQSEQELREVAREMAGKYSQPALVEEYITGREFTVGLLGERRPKVLPPMEICFTEKNGPLPVYSFEHKLDWNELVRYEAPAKLDPPVSRRMMDIARDIFQSLGCRDVARIDFRMDAAGKIYFIECNPLPGLTPGWSDLCLIAQAAGMDYRTLVGEIMSGAVRRYKERERERRAAERAEARAAATRSGHPASLQASAPATPPAPLASGEAAIPPKIG